LTTVCQEYGEIWGRLYLGGGGSHDLERPVPPGPSVEPPLSENMLWCRAHCPVRRPTPSVYPSDTFCRLSKRQKNEDRIVDFRQVTPLYVTHVMKTEILMPNRCVQKSREMCQKVGSGVLNTWTV